MTTPNPQDVGGLPELPEPTLTAYTKADGVTPFWKYDGMVMTHEGRHVGVGGNNSIHLFDADQMRAYGELCRAAPAGGVRVDGEMFICYLIDKCERETIYEESLQKWLADFLKNPRYHKPVSAPAVSATREGDGEVPKMLDRIAADLTDEGEHAPSVEQLAGEIRKAAALLRTLSRVAVQEGMVLVPREMTDAMIACWLTPEQMAGGKSGGDLSPHAAVIRKYNRMIAAAQRQEGGPNG